ncbi:PLC-like phosphodiesterase [Hypoxylon rubiginosum]|uniref:PLC-like phosphodiesterase n=1 Tax=Hypoxylon rubiginosum TaxID=110542 RepID=A0ACB9Z4L6_9PEZI|nr:PLC-like phosphodiesterase [Hypoxylon rubiginosum]
MNYPPPAAAAAAAAAPWARRRDAKPKPLPQAISHRGYKAAFPENTMAAFRGAVDVGAHAIETDLHLSRDGVVVLSHDATLKRCFGESRKVAECDWDYLRTLRTLREPKQPLPRLVDLLEYLDQPGQEHVWLFLDIKTDDDSTQMLTCLAAAIASVPSARPWNQRIMLGSWDAHWLAACLRFLPDFPVALTAYSPAYAAALLPLPNLHFSLFNVSFATPSGRRFLREARRARRLVFSWSDNADEYMALSLRNEVDGAMTDDPARFLELCGRWSEDGVRERVGRPTAKQAVLWVVFNVLVWVAEISLRLRKGSPRARVEKELGRVAP